MVGQELLCAQCSASCTKTDGYSRGGKAVRLTYDHKGSDTQEAKRIMDAGGFVMNNRVNGESRGRERVGDANTFRCTRSDEITW